VRRCRCCVPVARRVSCRRAWASRSRCCETGADRASFRSPRTRRGVLRRRARCVRGRRARRLRAADRARSASTLRTASRAGTRQWTGAPPGRPDTGGALGAGDRWHARRGRSRAGRRRRGSGAPPTHRRLVRMPPRSSAVDRDLRFPARRYTRGSGRTKGALSAPKHGPLRPRPAGRARRARRYQPGDAERFAARQHQRMTFSSCGVALSA
jgi:hypothetical protein